MEKVFIDPNRINYSLVSRVAKILSGGSIVALPSETVYGLGGCAENRNVLRKLYAIKKRPPQKPFSLALSSIEKVVNNYFAVLPPFGYRLIEKLWPGPLTIVYHSSQNENEKIGIRVPAHAVTREILNELKTAIYFPSANLSGQKEATTAEEVENIFDNEIDFIVDAGKCTYSKPSTVLDLTDKPFQVLREGVVSEEEIGAIFIKKRILFVCTGNSCRSPLAQFLLEKYLSQSRPYFQERYEIFSAGIVALQGLKAAAEVVIILKQKEGLDARNFYSQRLNSQMILSSDLIFTMEEAHSEYILKLEPTVEGRVFNLRKFLPPESEKDIPDPIGKATSFYEEIYYLIKEAILELINWL